MENNNPKIVFLGTPEFAVPVLKKLIDNNLKPFLVVTQPDKPAGRKQELTAPPVKLLAVENGIDVVQPSTKEDLTSILKDLEIDVCVLVAYGMIIPEQALEIPKMGFVNLHPSKLPKYRGPSPIQAALLNGDQETAVTIMKLGVGMDDGPIIVQENISIGQSDNFTGLQDKLSNVGAELMVKILPDYVAGKLELVDQDNALVTYCSIIKREDGQIDWTKFALDIERQFKAFSPWPGVFTHLNKKRLKIANLDVLKGDFSPDLTPGVVFLGPAGEFAVACGKGALSLESVQLEGKKEVSGVEFLNGQKGLIGKTLG